MKFLRDLIFKQTRMLLATPDTRGIKWLVKEVKRPISPQKKRNLLLMGWSNPECCGPNP